MAERIDIILAAVDKASRAFRTVGASADTLGKKNLRTLGDQAKRTQTQLNALNLAVAGIGKAVGGARNALAGFVSTVSFAGAVRGASQLEDSLARVRGLLVSTGASAEVIDAQFAQITETAREIGTRTAFSAKIAADGFVTLTRAGLDASESIASINPILQLAQGQSIQLAEAAGLVTNTLKAYQLEISNVTRITDVFTRAAGAANTTVDKLGDAVARLAPAAVATGKELEEITALTALLQERGFPAAQAFTAIRNSIARLAVPTREARTAIAGLGLSLGELAPQSNDTIDILQRLGEAGLDVASAKVIFGEEAFSAALAMAELAKETENGNSILGDFIQQLQNSEGATAAVSKSIEDTFSKAVARLGNNLLELGNALVGDTGLLNALTAITDFATAFVRGFTNVIRVLLGTRDATTQVEGILSVLAETIASTFAPIGDVFSFIGDLIRQLFVDINNLLTSIGNLFGLTTTQIDSTGDAVEGVTSNISILKTALIGIGLLVAGLEDGFRAIQGVVAFIGGLIAEGIGRALGTVITAVGNLVSIVDDDLARSLEDAAVRIGSTLEGVGRNSQQVARQIAQDFAEGRSAYARFQRRLEENAFKGLTDNSEDAKEKVVSDLQAIGREAIKQFSAIGQSLENLILADLQSQFIVFRAQAKRQIEALERDFRDGLIPINQFFSERLALQQQIINREIQISQKVLETTNNEVEAAQAAAKILVLQERSKALAAEAAAETASSIRDQADAYRELENRLSTLRDTPIDLSRLQAELESELRVTLNGFVAAGNEAGVELVDAIIQEELFRAKLENIKLEADRGFAEIADLQRRVSVARESGFLREAAAQRELDAAIIGQREALRSEIAVLRQEFAESGSTAALEQARQLEAQLDSLRTSGEQAAIAITQAFEQNLSGALVDVISGTKSLSDAFRSFALATAREVQKVILKLLLLRAASAFSPAAGSTGGSGLGGLAGFLAGAFGGGGAAKNGGFIQALAGGGPVRGPGGPTSDRVPIMASAGEYMIKAAAVKHYGLGMVELMNRMMLPKFDVGRAPPITFPKSLKFADGGAVGDSGTSTGERPTPVRIVNVLDPAIVGDFLGSSEAERQIVNVIRRNKAVLRSGA